MTTAEQQQPAAAPASPPRILPLAEVEKRVGSGSVVGLALIRTVDFHNRDGYHAGLRGAYHAGQ